MGYSIRTFRKDVEKLISLCNVELARRKKGEQGESSIEQLENMVLPELEYLLVKIDTNQLPPQSERYILSFANAFKVWGWNMNQPSEIFIRLVKLNDNYAKV